MPGVIREKPKSQKGDVPFFGQTSQREYAAFGCPDASSLVALIIASPNIVPTFDIVNGTSIFIEKYTYQEFGGGCWDVTAYYKGLGGQYRISADTTGGTRKAYVSEDTIANYDCTGVLPSNDPRIKDYKKAIGVTSSGVDGVDVIDPKFDITINATLKFSVLSANYLETLRTLTGKTNNAPYAINYKGQSLRFEREELLFRGVSFNQTATDDLDITYKFSGQKSWTADDNETVGQSGPITKQGWQYCWVSFEETIVAGEIARRPRSAYVERVFKSGDFTQFVL